MEKTISNSAIFQAMEEWAPMSLAYEWDNVGLQVGSHRRLSKKVMVTLDVLESVVDEAIKKNVDLIIAHHPLLFKSLKQVNTDTSKGRIIQKLIQNNISVYASHTNLDIATGGVNDILCDLLGLESRVNLDDTHTEKLFKFVVYVPISHMSKIRETIGKSGAGHIGNYSHCTFQTEGKGTFTPLEGTSPYIGSENQLEIVNEVKIETIVKESNLTNVVNDVINAHPYEEVAYDIFSLLNKGDSSGIGRVGMLEESVTLKTLCRYVKNAFDVSHVRVIGNLTKKVRKIAILGGSGEKFIHKAKQKGADVFITGDMSFHLAQDALEMGLCVIDPGHYIEKVMKKSTKDFLDQKFKQQEIEIILSETNTEPFQFV